MSLLKKNYRVKKSLFRRVYLQLNWIRMKLMRIFLKNAFIFLLIYYSILKSKQTVLQRKTTSFVLKYTSFTRLTTYDFRKNIGININLEIHTNDLFTS